MLPSVHMTEKMPSSPPPKGVEKIVEETADQAHLDARIAESAGLIEHWTRVEEAERRTIAAEPAEAWERKIAEFEELTAEFESRFSLVELHAITRLDPKEAPSHPLREPAKIALEPIVELLNGIKVRFGEESEQFKTAKAKYRVLSQAIGSINASTHAVDHTRG